MADSYEITGQTEVNRITDGTTVEKVMRVAFKAIPSNATATVEVPYTATYAADVAAAVGAKAAQLNQAAGV